MTIASEQFTPRLLPEGQWNPNIAIVDPNAKDDRKMIGEATAKIAARANGQDYELTVQFLSDGSDGVRTVLTDAEPPLSGLDYLNGQVEVEGDIIIKGREFKLISPLERVRLAQSTFLAINIKANVTSMYGRPVIAEPRAHNGRWVITPPDTYSDLD